MAVSGLLAYTLRSPPSPEEPDVPPFVVAAVTPMAPPF